MLCALAAAFAAAPAAQAAVEIGETPPPAVPSPEEGEPSMLPTVCPSQLNTVQAATGAAPRYTVPEGGGVIVSWRHRGATLAEGDSAGSGKLVVWRAAGSDTYTLVGKSGTATFRPNALTEPQPTRIPVEPGDQIGLRTEVGAVGCVFSHFDQATSQNDRVLFQYSDGAPEAPGGGGGAPSPPSGSQCISESIGNQTFEQATCHEEFCATFFDPVSTTVGNQQPSDQCRGFDAPSSANAADPEQGSTQTFHPVSGEGMRVNVTAVIEPDADGDGFGDETQDLCPTDASTAGPCPPPQTDDDGQLEAPPDITPPELHLFGKLKQRFRKVVRVAAACATQSCEVLATGRLIVKPPARERRRRGPGRFLRTRGFKLGPARATLGAGEKSALRLKIRRPAQKAANKALRQGGQVRAIVRVRATDSAGNNSFDRRALNLQKKGGRGSRRR